MSKINNDFSIERLGASAYRKWLSITLISSATSVAGLAVTISRPDSHPLVFVVCLSWLIALVVSGVTRDGLMRIDPIRFRLARWECEGRLYQKAGVLPFRWLLRHTPLIWLSPTLKLTSRRSGVERLVREMGFAEGSHLIGGVITLGFAMGYAAAGHAVLGLSLALLTILLHVYPVMLQRWNRGRALRLIRRLDSLAGSAERSAAPNGGPATQPGNSRVTEGPPSVS